MKPVLATLFAAAVVVAGCGGTDGEDRAKSDFRAYAAAELERSEAEGTLNRAFRDISKAARNRDRVGVVAAAERGQAAAVEIHGFLVTELEAAGRLIDYAPTSADARDLDRALRQSRQGLRVIEEELVIATRDPFLDDRDNGREISRLARQSLRLSVPAGFSRRRATRTIALTLGVPPPFDTAFDLPSPGT